MQAVFCCLCKVAVTHRWSRNKTADAWALEASALLTLPQSLCQQHDHSMFACNIHHCCYDDVLLLYLLLLCDICRCRSGACPRAGHLGPFPTALKPRPARGPVLPPHQRELGVQCCGYQHCKAAQPVTDIQVSLAQSLHTLYGQRPS